MASAQSVARNCRKVRPHPIPYRYVVEGELLGSKRRRRKRRKRREGDQLPDSYAQSKAVPQLVNWPYLTLPWTPPLPKPPLIPLPQIMCIGRNYAAHIAELNSATPKQPFFFLKPASSILLPGSGPMLRPKGVDVHYEVELGLVIGKTVRELREDDEAGAMEAISGMSFCLFMS